jgi:two-component system, cell cycle sensor histidine kinase and response regulator CckA
MSTPLHLLIVEDSPLHADLLLRELRRAGYEPVHERVDTAAALRAALERDAPDGVAWELLLSDYHLGGGFSGLEALRIFKESGLDVPFLIVTGSVGEDMAVEAMKAGAHDYILKSSLTRLPAVVARELREADGRRARQRAEEGLRASEAHLRMLIGQMPAVMWTTDHELRFTSTLGAALEGLNLRPHQVVGISVFDYLGTQDPELPAVAAHHAALRGESFSFELEWMGRTFQAHVEPLRDANGEISGTIGVGVDVSSQKRLEQELREAHKLEAVGRLAGGIAHEFNNLLAVISGYSELMAGELAESSPLRVQAQAILTASQRGAMLTRQILAFSRKQLLAPQILDLNELVESTSGMLRRLLGEEIELVTVLGEALGKIEADPGQLEQVLVNLALNARDAMPYGGRLTLATADVHLDRAAARRYPGVRPGRYILLSVSDSGLGIDPEILDHIFEPFFTTKDQGEGTGLGLSTVFGIVKQSGGEIWVDSEPGKGTTFKIALPVVDPEKRAKAGERNGAGVLAGGRARRRAGRTETVLLVEDEQMVRAMVRSILETRGYRVLEAGTGNEALDLAARYEGPVHVLLTDVVMPGMTGRQLADRLAALRPEIRILYISGHTDDEIIRRGVLQQGTGFLAKPFTADALTGKIRELLDAPAEERMTPDD